MLVFESIGVCKKTPTTDIPTYQSGCVNLNIWSKNHNVCMFGQAPTVLWVQRCSESLFITVIRVFLSKSMNRKQYELFIIELKIVLSALDCDLIWYATVFLFDITSLIV